MPVNSRGQRVKTNKKNQKIKDTENRLRKPRSKPSTGGTVSGAIGSAT